jgi:uncharacterized protein YacL
MNKTLLPIRLVFVAVCAVGGGLVCLTNQEWDRFQPMAISIGFLLGVLVVLTDVLLKGFSLRGLSAVSFGLGVGLLISYMLSVSPLFAVGDQQILYLVRLALFLIVPYLCMVIALRGKDEFNLVIPYVRFVPHEVDVPLIVVDTSALIDGRVAKLCEAGFLSAALVIPQFVLDELHAVADSSDPHRQARGRSGLETLNSLRKVKNVDIRTPESDVAKQQDVDAKLVFLAQSMKAKLLTTDFNLAKMAEFHGVQWLNLNQLAKALRSELVIGERMEVELVKTGKDEGQAVGYLEDGSMVVVANARTLIGRHVHVEISSVLPSAGGKMIFARLVSEAT